MNRFKTKIGIALTTLAVAVSVPVALFSASSHSAKVEVKPVVIQHHYSKYSPPAIPEYMLGMHYDPVLYDKLIKKQMEFKRLPFGPHSLYGKNYFRYETALGNISFSDMKPTNADPSHSIERNIFSDEKNRQDLLKAVLKTHIDTGVGDFLMHSDQRKTSITFNYDLDPWLRGQTAGTSIWINNYLNLWGTPSQKVNWNKEKILRALLIISLHEHAHLLDMIISPAPYVIRSRKLFFNDINDDFKRLYKLIVSRVKCPPYSVENPPDIDFHKFFHKNNVPTWDKISKTDIQGFMGGVVEDAPSEGGYLEEMIVQILSAMFYIDPFSPGNPIWEEMEQRHAINSKFGTDYFWGEHTSKINFKIMKSYFKNMLGIDGKDTVYILPHDSIHFSSLQTPLTKSVCKVVIHYKDHDMTLNIKHKQSPIGFNWIVGQDDKSRYKYILDRASAYYKKYSKYDKINYNPKATEEITDEIPMRVELLDKDGHYLPTNNFQLIVGNYGEFMKGITVKEHRNKGYRLVNNKFVEITKDNPWPNTENGWD